MERLTRRQFLQVATVAAETIILASCAPSRPVLPPVVAVSSGEAKGSYPLFQEADGSLTDGRLDFRQHPFLEAIRFSFDPNQSEGALIMATTHRQDSEYRLITEEMDSRSEGPGLIYCKSRLVKAGVLTQSPVIRFAALEEYLISLGFKLPGAPDCLTTYQNMETYYITRDNNGVLQGRFEGIRTFNPADPNFKPRDSEARYYFDKNCVS